MDFTLENVKTMKANSESPLENYVLDYIIDKWDEYNDAKDIVTDVLHHGCVSGCVGGLIYFSQTTAFYEQHKAEINDVLYEACDSIGIHCLDEFFGERWEQEDPLALYDNNQNVLAWFGFEETMRNIALQFEDLEEIIY